jgi:hypothetical protein
VLSRITIFGHDIPCSRHRLRQKKSPEAENLRGIAFSNETYLLLRYSSIALAATLPAPIAEMTVAAPVTASPPA